MRQFALGLCGLILIAGCSTTTPCATSNCACSGETVTPPANAAAEPDDCPAIDDQGMVALMSRKTDELFKAKKITPMTDLIKQLSRKQCALTLPAPSKTPMTPEAIYANRAQSTLLVGGFYKCKHCPKWHVNPASGFAITESTFVTNYHVVNNPSDKAIAVMTRAGKVFPVMEVLAASEADDLAILRVDTGKDKLTPAPLLAANPPVGSEVTCISHPKGRLFSLTHGLVSRFFQTSNRIKGKKTAKTIMMTVTADYAAGSSGGPIFGPNGNIAGVVSSTYSAYYSMKKGIARDLQMVFKQTIPVSQIHKLIKK